MKLINEPKQDSNFLSNSSSLYIPKVNYRIHKSPPSLLTLNWMSSVHVFLPFFFEIYININIQLRLFFQNYSFPSSFPIKTL